MIINKFKYKKNPPRPPLESVLFNKLWEKVNWKSGYWVKHEPRHYWFDNHFLNSYLFSYKEKNDNIIIAI